MSSELESRTVLARPEIADHYEKSAAIVYACCDALDGLRDIPDKAIQLIVSSPPYNIGKSYEVKVELGNYLRQMEPALRELVRVLSPRGSLCWQVGNFVSDGEVFPLDIYYYPIFKNLGLQLRNRVIWHFDHGLHCSKRFSGRYETLMWFTKTDSYTFNLDAVRMPSKYPGKTHYKSPKQGLPSGNSLGKNPSDIWSIVLQDWESGLWNIPNLKCNPPEKTTHPCQFPVELVQRCVLAFSNEEDCVLDPFAGVGSALIAAIMHDRRAIGFDLNSQFVEEGRARIESFYNGTLKVRPIGKPIYQPSGREKVAQVPHSWKKGPQSAQNELFALVSTEHLRR